MLRVLDSDSGLHQGWGLRIKGLGPGVYFGFRGFSLGFSLGFGCWGQKNQVLLASWVRAMFLLIVPSHQVFFRNLTSKTSQTHRLGTSRGTCTHGVRASGRLLNPKNPPGLTPSTHLPSWILVKRIEKLLRPPLNNVGTSSNS